MNSKYIIIFLLITSISSNSNHSKKIEKNKNRTKKESNENKKPVKKVDIPNDIDDLDILGTKLFFRFLYFIDTLLILFDLEFDI